MQVYATDTTETAKLELNGDFSFLNAGLALHGFGIFSFDGTTGTGTLRGLAFDAGLVTVTQDLLSDATATFTLPLDCSEGTTWETEAIFQEPTHQALKLDVTATLVQPCVATSVAGPQLTLYASENTETISFFFLDIRDYTFQYTCGGATSTCEGVLEGTTTLEGRDMGVIMLFDETEVRFFPLYLFPRRNITIVKSL